MAFPCDLLITAGSSKPVFGYTDPFRYSKPNLMPTSIRGQQRKVFRSMVSLFFSEVENTTEDILISLLRSGILNTTRTPMGKTLIRDWFLRPLMDLDAISLRHDAVSLFSRVENRKPVEEIKTHLHQIANFRRLLNSLRRGKVTVRDWKFLLEVRPTRALIR